MRKIFIYIDEDMRVDGWSSSQSSNSIEVEVEDEHDVLSRWSSFKYIDGKLEEETDYLLPVMKKDRFKDLSLMCQQDILGYFEATVNGVSYMFSFDNEAQGNFTGTMTLFLSELVSEVQWTAHRDGVAERITLNRENFSNVAMKAFALKDMKISRLRGEIQDRINSAQTIEEINAINW